MDAQKVTPALAQRLASAGVGESLVVVIELRPLPPSELDHGSRAERISRLRHVFERQAGVVEAAVAAAGGEVLNTVWLNQSIVVRVSAGALGELTHAEEVRRIDLPRRLRFESS
jgi:hypothetical protein